MAVLTVLGPRAARRLLRAHTRPAAACGWPPGSCSAGPPGNLIDRLRLGAVTDFVDLPWWPAFNVADAAITVGVLGLLATLDTGRAHREEPA